jgi:hypothetical protein
MAQSSDDRAEVSRSFRRRRAEAALCFRPEGLCAPPNGRRRSHRTFRVEHRAQRTQVPIDLEPHLRPIESASAAE